MKDMQTINIATALNSKYMRYAYVMLSSLFRNHSNDVNIHIYLLYSDLTKRDQGYLEELVARYGGILHWLMVDRKKFPNTLKVSESWSLEAYYRLLLPDMLPQEVDRILYLDVDIIINKSLVPLYLTDFEGNDICACEDSNTPPFTDYRDVLFEEQIQSGFTYFCSGVTLWNIEQMRGKYRFEDYMKLAEKLEYKMVAPDQDLLNYIHWESTKIVEATQYNLYAKVAYNHDVHYEEVKQAVTVIHFIGHKPWQGQYVHYDIEQLWWDYAKQTPFYHELMEEFLYDSMHDSVIYDTMMQLSEEKKRLSEELAKSTSLCRQLLQMVQNKT